MEMLRVILKVISHPFRKEREMDGAQTKIEES